MITNPCSIVALIAGLLLPVISVADPSFTVSAGVSHSTADTLSPGGLSTTLKDDFSGAGNRFGIGFSLHNWISFDAGWARFGTNTGSVEFPTTCVGSCPPGTPPRYTQTIKQDGSAYWLAYTPYIERGQWRFLGAVGIARSNIRSVYVGSNFAQENRENGLLLGAGAAYFFSEHLGVRFDAEKLGSEASQVAVSLTVRF